MTQKAGRADLEGKIGGDVKLNIGRTVMVGLAFFTITMFWQVYDSMMPLFLLDFDFNAWQRGLIMALDNVLALFLLPFMGLLSDKFPLKLRAKFGRRIPFIVCGSILAGITFLLVNFAHNERMLGLMLASTAFVLVFMCLYRTPAVALMPDVTPKKIRSQANTIINIMGTVGGFITLILMNLLVKKQDVTIGGAIEKVIVGNNWWLVSIIVLLMVVSSVIMIFKVKENKLVEKKKQYLAEMGICEDDDIDDEDKPKSKGSTKQVLSSLDKPHLKSLFLLLISVFLWYMGYNAVTTHFSVFASKELLTDFTLPLMVAQGAAFIMFVPASMLGKKIGRKGTILIGIILMCIGLGFSTLLLYLAPIAVTKIAMYPAFVLVGAGWATINVHSYVMSVEMASKNTTGVFTGLYYTFAMSAQALTPFLAGLFMEGISNKALLPYAFIFVALAFVTMSLVKHGNASDKPISNNLFSSNIKEDTTAQTK